MFTKKRKRKTKIHPGQLEIGLVNEHSLFWPMLTAVIIFTFILMGLWMVAP
jgi:hypothetical protein